MTYVNVAFTAKGLGDILGASPGRTTNVRTLSGSVPYWHVQSNGVTGDSTTDIAAFTVRDGSRRGLRTWPVTPAPEASQAAQVAHAVVIIGADFEQDLQDEVADSSVSRQPANLRRRRISGARAWGPGASISASRTGCPSPILTIRWRSGERRRARGGAGRADPGLHT